MTSINYLTGVFKVLEKPRSKILNDVLVTQFRAQLSNVNKTLILDLTFWGNLAQNVKVYYKVNDYIVIEGYISIRKHNNEAISNTVMLQKMELTILKVYPFHSILDYSDDLIVDNLR